MYDPFCRWGFVERAFLCAYSPLTVRLNDVSFHLFYSYPCHGEERARGWRIVRWASKHLRPTASLFSDRVQGDTPRGDSSTDNSIMLACRCVLGREPTEMIGERTNRIMKFEDGKGKWIKGRKLEN